MKRYKFKTKDGLPLKINIVKPEDVSTHKAFSRLDLAGKILQDTKSSA